LAIKIHIRHQKNHKFGNKNPHNAPKETHIFGHKNPLNAPKETHIFGHKIPHNAPKEIINLAIKIHIRHQKKS
jgi:hypothetical protein